MVTAHRFSVFIALSASIANGFVSPHLKVTSRGSNGFDIALYADTTPISARPAITWFKEESLESLLPKDDLRAILSELLSDESFVDDSEDLFSRNWNKLESRLGDETRSLSELLGEQTTEQLLKAVKKIDEYDPETVRAFLSSTAINTLFSKILYDGIFEFFQKIDVFGQIINNLPIIGPIRKQIVTETKRQLDRSLGPLVQNFLATYTKIAVMQASDFILSPENRNAFGSANAKLVSSLLGRPVNSLLPPGDTGEKILAATFEYLRKVDSDDFDEYIDFIYGFAEDKSLDRLVNVDRLVDSSPTLQKTLDSFWTRAVEAKASD
jgi:hypothetical protein